MPRYRLFCEDVGPGKFSAIKDVSASSPKIAVKVEADWERATGQRVIALPYNRRDLWPNGHTGAVPTEALKYR